MFNETNVRLNILSADVSSKTPCPKVTIFFFAYFVSSNPIPDEEMVRSTEDLSSTGPTVTDRHARALTAVSAYGASVALNKTRQRPVSAKIASSQGEVKAIFSVFSRRIHAKNQCWLGAQRCLLLAQAFSTRA